MAEIIVARVSLRIVATDSEALHKELNLISKRNRNYIDGWNENYYGEHRKPRSKKDKEAIKVITERFGGDLGGPAKVPYTG